MRNDGGNNTDEWVNVAVVFVGCLPYILLAIAAASRLDIVMPAAVNATDGVLRSQILVFIIATLAIWIVVHITIQVRERGRDALVSRPGARRWAGLAREVVLAAAGNRCVR